MERQSDNDPRLAAVIDAIRTYHLEAANAGEDDALDPLDRRNRTDVAPGTKLQLDDDVWIAAAEHATRVACAASSRDHFYGVHISPEDGPWIQKYSVSEISDRAPVDSAEPAPWFPVELEPPIEEP